jgi:hypothetical protein
MEETRWFVMADGRRKGPFTQGELLMALMRQPDPGNTPVWRSGLAEWVPAGSLAQVVGLIPPPLPGSAVAPQPQKVSHGARDTNVLFPDAPALHETRYASPQRAQTTDPSHTGSSGARSQPKWTLLAALIGAVIIWIYSGLALTIPLVGAAVVWAIVSRTASGNSKHLLPAIAVQGGHVIWYLVAVIASGGEPAYVWIVLLMTGGLIWLFRRPGLAPLVLLTAWQSFALLSNLRQFVDAEIGALEHKALLVELILRVAAIWLMIVGIRALAQRPAGAARR